MRTAALLSTSIEGADDYDKFLCNQKELLERSSDMDWNALAHIIYCLIGIIQTIQTTYKLIKFVNWITRLTRSHREHLLFRK